MALHPKRKDIKLLQEEAHDVKVRLDRMNPRDPKFEATQNEMVEKAQRCGYAYRRYLKGEGRDLRWKGMNERPNH